MEKARAEYLLAPVESVAHMTPQEAAELLDLALVLFALMPPRFKA